MNRELASVFDKASLVSLVVFILWVLWGGIAIVNVVLGVRWPVMHDGENSCVQLHGLTAFIRAHIINHIMFGNTLGFRLRYRLREANACDREDKLRWLSWHLFHLAIVTGLTGRYDPNSICWIAKIPRISYRTAKDSVHYVLAYRIATVIRRLINTVESNRPSRYKISGAELYPLL